MASGLTGDDDPKWFWTSPSEVIEDGGAISTVQVRYTDASNVDNYSCTQSIGITAETLPGINLSRINFQFNGTTGANAYGRKFFQNTAPSSVCDGDIWYDTSNNTGGGGESPLIPSGAKMLFYQSSAPTGWSKISTHNNKALRVVSGSGGGSGGNNSFTSTFATKSTGNHTLTRSQIPGHNHGYDFGWFAENIGHGSNSKYGTTLAGSNKGRDYDNSAFFSAQNTTNGSEPPGGGSHNHGNIDLRVQYVDVIICTKS
tara:strand:- start:1947 stop:2717 length:771 start_codon:yes stop_codon:yes gene_type:complete